MDLSIIIVTWNNEREICDCINSIQNTISEHSYEILICDNCSADKTVSIVKEKFPSIIVLSSNKNLGFACANNLMLKEAKGKYVLYLNPDTIMQERTVDQCLEFLKNNSHYGAVTCKLLNNDGSIQQSIYKLPGGWKSVIENFGLHIRLYSTIGKLLGYSYEYSHKIECCMGAFLMMRRCDVDKIGGFSEEYFMYLEDGDICYKIINLLKKPIYYLSEVTCIHLGGRSEAQDLTSSKLIKTIDSLDVFARLYYNYKRVRFLSNYRYIYITKYFFFKILSIISPIKYVPLRDTYKEGIDYITMKMNRG